MTEPIVIQDNLSGWTPDELRMAKNRYEYLAHKDESRSPRQRAVAEAKLAHIQKEIEKRGLL